MNKYELLEQEFSNLSSSKGCYYFSDGKWSLHDLLAYLLTLSGKANVYISTYGVSESSVREFLRLKDDGLMLSLKCLIDFSVKSQKSGILFFANNIADEIRLAANHSKLILIDGEKLKITVITSANFTVNPRYECGNISTNKKVYEFFTEKFHQAFNKALPLKYE